MTTLPIFRRPEIIDINMPYADSGMNIRLAAGNLLGVFESKINRIKPAENVSAVIADALNKPTGSPPLGVLAKGKKRITIITSDHTRPVPSKNTMPVLLSEIRRTNPSAQIIILIATGFHRPSTREELIEKFGMQIASKEKIIVHDAFNEKQNIHLGRLSSGNELAIDQYACNTDLLIAEGFIEPHFFAGFSGGRKSVLPGIAGIKSILANHSSSMIAHPCARAGSLKNNPLHLDMIEAAEKAGLSFILNVIINHEKKIIKAFAGDFKKAHDRGTAYLKKLSRIKKTMSDIVITSNGGYPLDQNIYQAVKCMSLASKVCRKNGVIIVIAGCECGHGGEEFYLTLKNASSLQELQKKISATGMFETRADQWESQILVNILLAYHVILVSGKIDPQIVTDMHIGHAGTFEAAMEKAYGITGKNAKISVIPDGVSVFV